jgi:hypothetical protein
MFEGIPSEIELIKKHYIESVLVFGLLAGFMGIGIAQARHAARRNEGKIRKK